MENQKIEGKKSNRSRKLNQPPRKKHVKKPDIRIIFEYSAKKKNTKPTDEYSTL